MDSEGVEIRHPRPCLESDEEFPTSGANSPDPAQDSQASGSKGRSRKHGRPFHALFRYALRRRDYLGRSVRQAEGEWAGVTDGLACSDNAVTSNKSAQSLQIDAAPRPLEFALRHG